MLLIVIYLLNFNIVASILVLFICLFRKTSSRRTIKENSVPEHSKKLHQITNGTTKSRESISDTKTPAKNSAVQRSRSKTTRNSTKTKESPAAKTKTVMNKKNLKRRKKTTTTTTAKEDLEEPTAAREASQKEEKPIVEQTKTFSWNSNNLHRKDEPSPSIDDFDRSSALYEMTATDLRLSPTQVDSQSDLLKMSTGTKTKTTTTVTTVTTQELKPQTKPTQKQPSSPQVQATQTSSKKSVRIKTNSKKKKPSPKKKISSPKISPENSVVKV
uniref:Uncharacterized protein n=1 Tax=Panagrolaimus sp. ES5 TaxID=591445 RepID=A0AC34F0S8_9BILA